MNCNTTHYRANSSSVPGDPTTRKRRKTSSRAIIRRRKSRRYGQLKV